MSLWFDRPQERELRSFKKSPQQLKKVKGAERLLLDSEAEDEDGFDVELIVKVNAPGYVPPEIELRTRIDDTMFTGNTAVSNLKNLDMAEKVQSISVTKRLRIIE